MGKDYMNIPEKNNNEEVHAFFAVVGICWGEIA
jgi:hypothetical protein